MYGEDLPAYTASYDGFVNGDDEGEVDGLEIDGAAPAGADVGDYAITRHGRHAAPTTPSTYVAGTEHVTRAPLTITADDKTRVYGAKSPAYTASYDGLVNGDTKADITGLVLDGPAERLGRREVRHHARPAPATPTTTSSTPPAPRPSPRRR